jgi:diguanylate cyclase (GGDEF)-like protein
MFNELLDAELQRTIRYKTDLSLIMFDLDHFKQVNDRFGHATGDHVLQEIARLVSDNIRCHDVLCRLGGEEFILLVPKNNRVQALEFAEKLRGLIETYDFGDSLRITASFGVTQFMDKDCLEGFTDRVDKALYQAKERGRNRCDSI